MISLTFGLYFAKIPIFGSVADWIDPIRTATVVHFFVNQNRLTGFFQIYQGSKMLSSVRAKPVESGSLLVVCSYS